MQNMIEVFEDPKSGIKQEDLGVDFSFFESGNSDLRLKNNTEGAPMVKQKRPRKKKLADGTEYVAVDMGNPNKAETEEPYIDSYAETNNMLRASIGQIDQLSTEIKSELDTIRASKTLKNKYNYIAELTSTSGTLLGTKITAIREMNKVISDCHSLEIKRIKDLKLSQDDQDDDKKIMDLYNAFINAPISSGGAGAPPSIIPSASEITLGVNGVNPMVAASDVFDAGYANYVANLTPEQNRMRMENNPNIQTIVVFNPETGERHFDVIDKSTGQSVPNISRPDEFLFEDITIDVRNQVARNTAIDTVYPLVVIGGNGAINEY